MGLAELRYSEPTFDINFISLSKESLISTVLKPVLCLRMYQVIAGGRELSNHEAIVALVEIGLPPDWSKVLAHICHIKDVRYKHMLSNANEPQAGGKIQMLYTKLLPVPLASGSTYPPILPNGSNCSMLQPIWSRPKPFTTVINLNPSTSDKNPKCRRELQQVKNEDSADLPVKP
ncbi:hypothetical protein BDZ91DRAFT_815764 [Kalaharituber pfeilii]|nr:hypothetical protein BDZ91DRAFT_815764 [Kalaharituber pfeilii]